MKFGGTSVADVDRIRNVARHVKREVDAGNKVAVIVSAMAGTTNQLVAWVNDASKSYDRREYDAVVATGEQITAGLLAIVLQSMNVAFLVGLAFAVAASANLPAIVLSVFWKRFNTTGAVAGLSVGLLSSIVLIILSPSIMGIDPETMVKGRHLIQAKAVFPLTHPAIVSIPLGFLAAIIGSLMSRDPEAEAKFAEFKVRAHTGLGSEKATAH